MAVAGSGRNHNTHSTTACHNTLGEIWLYLSCWVGEGGHSLCALLMGLSSSSLSGPEHHSSPLYGCFLSSTHRRLLRGATSPVEGHHDQKS